MSEKLWYKVARTIIKAGRIPFPISDTLYELLKLLLNEEQAKFILIFQKPSLNINQLKEKTDLSETELDKMLNELMDNGLVVGMPSRRTGIMVYRLMGLFPGIFEYILMKGEKTEREYKFAKIFERLNMELSQKTQENYDELMVQYKTLIPALSRVVPVEEEIEVPQEEVLPSYEVSKIIDRYDDIAVSHCYCRHEKDLLEDPCKVTNEKFNCFHFGKSARYVVEHNFGKSVSKDEAKKIFKVAEEDGLVHKAFHVHSDLNKEEEAICNCCKCCCGIFQMYYRGIFPYHTITSYLAVVDEDECNGCGTCVEKCPIEAPFLVDDIAIINSEKCIGCGVCVHHCPQQAIKLEYNKRNVYLSAKKLAIN